MISYVLLLHLLIAILTNVYEKQAGRVDCEFRAMIIHYYYKWKWDKMYGFLIFLPPSFTIVSSILSPIIIIADSKRINKFLSKLFYFVYVIPNFLMFALVNFLLIIPV